MKPKILLAEDDTNLGYVISDQLKERGYRVVLALDGSDALQKFHQDQYHLCILDVMMPKKDGFSLAKDIRKLNKEIPIIFLTAKSMTEDKIEGLKIGADDYLTKPFNFDELDLRIKSLLKRSNILDKEEEQTVYKLKSYTFDSANYSLTKDLNSKILTKKEAQILLILVRFKNQIVTREMIMNGVWGMEDYFIGRSLDVFITKLRKYLSEDSSILITNIHGVGFKLELLP
ncbi:MAG: response regulator transcription factor [Flavobacteriia bacterium]|nr:response regulator transcription factor [Flavobacteriia bacterium]